MKNKKIIAAASLVIIAVLVFAVLNIQRTENYYSEEFPSEGESVSIEINCSSILDNYSELDENLRNEKYVPADGVILAPVTVYISEGDSVFDVLQRVTKEYKIQMEYEESPTSIYVEGINYLYEFSCGDLSGWMYSVNGDFAQVGCESYILQDGDVIKWLYTCDLGRDIGGGM